MIKRVIVTIGYNIDRTVKLREVHVYTDIAMHPYIAPGSAPVQVPKQVAFWMARAHADVTEHAGFTTKIYTR